jgi:tetratricopeptide (TPR) repeat protein
VFVGGWTLHAALAIGAGPNDTDAALLDQLTALVSKNLVYQHMQPNGTARFAMLETIREYAQEQLAASGDGATPGQRHATYYLALAEAAEQEAQHARQVDWLEDLETEHDNLRAALIWALEHGDVAFAARLGGALVWFWNLHGHRREGRMWLDRVLARREPLPAKLQAKALDGVGVLAANQGDFVSAQAAYDAGLRCYRQISDRRGVARVLEHLGWMAMFQDQAARAAALLEESLMLYRMSSDTAGQAAVLNHLGLLALFQAGHDQAARYFEASLACYRAIDDPAGIAQLHNHLGLLALVRGDHPRAIEHFEEGLRLCRACGNRGDSAHLLNHLGKVALIQGDPARAQPYFVESLVAFQALGDRQGIAWGLAGIGGVAALQGQALRAARLLSAAAALRERIGAPIPIAGRALYDQLLAVAQSQLDAVTWARAWALGRTLTPNQAIADALALEYHQPAELLAKHVSHTIS